MLDSQSKIEFESLKQDPRFKRLLAYVESLAEGERKKYAGCSTLEQFQAVKVKELAFIELMNILYLGDKKNGKFAE